MYDQYDPIATRRAELQRQITEAQRGLDTIQLVPVKDEYPDGAVIKAEIRYGSGFAVTYLFLKVGIEPNDKVRWYHTGSIQHNRRVRDGGGWYFVSWRELQSWLIERGRVVESWEILAPVCTRYHAPLQAPGGIVVHAGANWITQTPGKFTIAWNDINKRWETT